MWSVSNTAATTRRYTHFLGLRTVGRSVQFRRLEHIHELCCPCLELQRVATVVSNKFLDILLRRSNPVAIAQFPPLIQDPLPAAGTNWYLFWITARGLPLIIGFVSTQSLLVIKHILCSVGRNKAWTDA